jgi:nucleoside 2-deoxyribosyltransferase
MWFGCTAHQIEALFRIMEEKRKYERLNVERIDALAILNPEPGPSDKPVVGRLIDISEGGMGSEYIVLDNTAEALIHAGCEVSIIRSSAPLGIAWRRAAIFVHDELFLTRSFALITVRRCGLKWVEPLFESEMESLVSTAKRRTSNYRSWAGGKSGPEHFDIEAVKNKSTELGWRSLSTPAEKVMKIYFAGPLFSEAERDWLRATISKIESLAGQRGTKIKIIFPYDLITQEEIDRLDDRAKVEIFSRCKSHLDDADIVIALLDGSQVDDRTAWEIGYFYTRKSPERKIIGIRTDFRRAGESEGAVVNAMVECSCDWIVRSTKKLLTTISRLF